MSDTIIEQLKAEKFNLEEEISVRQTRLRKVDGALAALDGKPGGKSEKSVPEMAEMAARALCADNPALVMDSQKIVGKVIELFPSAEKSRIKTGIYSAIAKLTKKKILEKCPGGFRLLP